LQFSFLLAAVVTVTVLILSCCSIFYLQGLGTGWRFFFSVLLCLPSGISVLVLSLAFWISLSDWVDPFEGSFLAMVFLQAMICFPLAFRALWPTAQGFQRKQLECARSLGAGPLNAFFLVEWPRWRGPVMGTAAWIVSLSLSEIAAVNFFASESHVPLPAVISRWLLQYRFADAQGAALVLGWLSLGLIVFVSLVRLPSRDAQS
jgi:ABC-type Fe3+ transport system permease subunit